MIALATIGFIGAHLLAFLLLASTCFLLGRFSTWRIVFRSQSEALAIRTMLGFGLAGELLFLLGLARLLYAWLVVLLVVLVHLAAVPLLRESWPRIREAWRSSTAAARWIAAAFLSAAFLPAFTLALYPPTAFDATLYHLPYAATFAREHAVVFIDTLRFPLFPQLNEMLFTGMLLTYDDVATHLVQLLALLTTACLLYAWASRYGQRAALWAAALWLGNPIALYLGSVGYVDAGLALFFTGALLCWIRWNEGGEQHWLLLSAASAGFAAGTKYHGLLVIVALSIATLWRSFRERRWKAIPTFIVAAALLASPFYIRNYVETGNPVFPFLSRTFGVNEWPTGVDREIETSGSVLGATLSARLGDLREDPAAAATYLWRLSSDRRTLAGHPPYSPFYLLLAPLIVWLAVTRSGLRVAAVIAFAYLLFVSGRDVRFILPVAAFFALYGGEALDRLLTRRHAISVLITLLLLSPGLAWTARLLWQRGPLPVTSSMREAYLSEHVSGYTQLVQLNRQHARDYTIYALGFENAAYFAEGRFLGDHLGPYRFERVRAQTDAPSLYRELGAMRADYLLVNASERLPALDDPASGPLFEPVATEGDVRLFRLADITMGP
ncbi:MAG TPA: glycosyltransferase family 39 protein [Thermoanaerobaculia bacterium]